jgi:hypothetical protein
VSTSRGALHNGVLIPRRFPLSASRAQASQSRDIKADQDDQPRVEDLAKVVRKAIPTEATEFRYARSVSWASSTNTLSNWPASGAIDASNLSRKPAR